MKNSFLLLSSMLLMGLSVLKVYDFYAPKEGPIGNGPSETLIRFVWISSTVSFAAGLAIFCTAIIMILKKKNRVDK